MTCLTPPQPADSDLLAYLDGEADDQVIAHLKQCPHCRERAQRLAHLQGRLTAQLYRFDCPSPQELGEYHLGILPADQTSSVGRHLAECPRCARELAQLQAYLAELGPTLEFSRLEQARERVRVLVARLASRGREGGLLAQPALVPAYAGVRGGEGEPFFYKADEIQVVVEIQEDPDQSGRKTVLGLVIGIEELRELEVHLWRDDQRLATTSVDETSNFFIPNLDPGRYELILSGPELEIHIQGLDVGTHKDLSGAQEP